jgi:hypothetical protein
VLQSAGAYTITGAIIVEPRGDKANDRSVGPFVTGMPDFSQNFNPAWPGLCGPTSAADVLYHMAISRPDVLPGIPRGPSAEADNALAEMLTGSMKAILPQSLAGRMGSEKDGDGTTNIGVQQGLESWLSEYDANRWTVSLEWFDDEPRDRSTQQLFLNKLADGLAAGGGAVLCLWPGTEYVDGAVSDASESPGDREAPASPGTEAPDRVPSVPPVLPPAEFPAPPPPPPPAVPTSSLPGSPTTPEEAMDLLRQAEENLDRAEEELNRDNPTGALRYLANASSLIANATAAPGEQYDAVARRAEQLSRRTASQLPPPSEGVLQERTLFK